MLRRFVIAGTIGAALLAACGDAATPSSSAPEQDAVITPDEPGEPSGAEPTPPAQPVDDEQLIDDGHPLAFDARLLNGGTFDASQFAGQPVALWMWAPW